MPQSHARGCCGFQGCLGFREEELHLKKTTDVPCSSLKVCKSTIRDVMKMEHMTVVCVVS